MARRSGGARLLQSQSGLYAPYSAYRFHLGDAVSFDASIRVTIEHGGVDEKPDPYASVAYYYLNPTPHLALADSVGIGDAGSK